MTFLTTRPPAPKASPRPLTPLNPRKWSRGAAGAQPPGTAPAGHDAAADRPCPAGKPQSGPKSGGSKASCWPCAASRPRDLRQGVAGRAVEDQFLGLVGDHAVQAARGRGSADPPATGRTGRRGGCPPDRRPAAWRPASASRTASCFVSGVAGDQTRPSQNRGKFGKARLAAVDMDPPELGAAAQQRETPCPGLSSPPRSKAHFSRCCWSRSVSVNMDRPSGRASRRPRRARRSARRRPRRRAAGCRRRRPRRFSSSPGTLAS